MSAVVLDAFGRGSLDSGNDTVNILVTRMMSSVTVPSSLDMRSVFWLTAIWFEVRALMRGARAAVGLWKAEGLIWVWPRGWSCPASRTCILVLDSLLVALVTPNMQSRSLLTLSLLSASLFGLDHALAGPEKVVLLFRCCALNRLAGSLEGFVTQASARLKK